MRERRLYLWAAALVALSALAVHAAYYFPFFSDDALISLRYAKRLCTGHGLTWTDGERVEGYTDLLWVLLNAPAACVRADPMWSARVLDFLGCAAAVTTVALSPANAREFRLPRFVAGSLALSLSAPVAVWAIGGLEHGFMLGVLAVALWFARKDDPETAVRDCQRASLCFGLLALLRADGVVLFVSATAARFLFRSGRAAGLRAAAWWFAFPVALLVAQLLFRLAYYHEVVPNTAVAKVSFSLFRLRQGIDYVRQGYTPIAGLAGAAFVAVGLCARGPSRVRLAVPLFVALGWTAYVALVGGDIFPGWRQLLFVTAPFAFLVADGGEAIVARFPGRAAWAFTSAWAAALAGHLWLQFGDSENIRAKHELWEWDGEPIGLALKKAFGDKSPLFAVDAAGALPYWSELPALDMLGLNDHYIPRHPPPGFGRGVIGHELGDPDYVWQRSPDLIAFCGARGNVDPCFVSGRGIYRRYDFRSVYQHVRFQGADGPVGDLYVKREGGKIGALRASDRVTVPGYLFTDGPAIVTVDDTGPVNRISVGVSGRIERLRVEAGVWSVATDPPNPNLLVAFTCDGVSPRKSTGAPRTLHVADGAAIDVSIGMPDDRPESLPLRNVILTRETSANAAFECDRATPREPVLRDLADLDRRPVEGTDWARPEAVRFGRAGLRVAFPHVLAPTSFSLSADGNDRYSVQFLRNGTEVARAEVPFGGAGLHTRNVGVPREAAEHGADSALVTPLAGDGAYSVDSLEIRE